MNDYNIKLNAITVMYAYIVSDKTYRRPEAGVYEHNGNCSAAAIC